MPPRTAHGASTFYCSLCSKGYARQNEYDNHLSSYDHTHAVRRNDLRKISADPRDAEKAAKEKRRREKGLVTLDGGKVAKTTPKSSVVTKGAGVGGTGGSTKGLGGGFTRITNDSTGGGQSSNVANVITSAGGSDNAIGDSTGGFTKITNNSTGVRSSTTHETNSTDPIRTLPMSLKTDEATKLKPEVVIKDRETGEESTGTMLMDPPAGGLDHPVTACQPPKKRQYDGASDGPVKKKQYGGPLDSPVKKKGRWDSWTVADLSYDLYALKQSTSCGPECEGYCDMSRPGAAGIAE